MILSAARVMGDDQESFIVEAISKLQAYKQALGEG